jgi:glucose-1-phosphate adenylyltransferase
MKDMNKGTDVSRPEVSARFVSRLTKQTIAMVLAGGRGSRLADLTQWRAKPAVPFAGKYRIIDFTLSNCLNSNIRRICVLTQYKAHYLIKHIQQGWSHFNAEHGEFVDIVPAQQWVNENSWYQGTADAVFQSLDIIQSHAPEYVLILAGDHVYDMDYGEMLAAHFESGADFTIACLRVPRKEATGFGVMAVDENYRIVNFEEKPDDPRPTPDDPDSSLASMGIYVFSMKYLRTHLNRDASEAESSHDFGKDLIPYAINAGHHVNAYPFRNPGSGEQNYWRDVGTVDAYYEANMELLSTRPPLNLASTDWPLFTYQQQAPPARFNAGRTDSLVDNVLVSGGCRIGNSSLSNSMLFSNSRVRGGCELDGCLVLPQADIGRGSKLKNVIVDNGCMIPGNSVIGYDPEEDRKRFHVTDNGVVVVTSIMLGDGPAWLMPARFSS